MAVMGWTNPRTLKEKQDLRQQELFPTLSEEEQKVLSTLDGVDQKPVNQIVIDANIPFSRVSAILFELELKGLVKVLGGARYKRLR
jgi:DNA processing protein